MSFIRLVSRAFACVILVSILLSGPLRAFGRAGGGESYHGGSGGGGGGGSYGGGWSSSYSGSSDSSYGGSSSSSGLGLSSEELVILIAVIVGVVLVTALTRASKDNPPASPPRRRLFYNGGWRSLQGLREIDASFSAVAFADFTYALFHEVHRARGEGKLSRYGAYLSVSAIETLRYLAPRIDTVDRVIVGAWHLANVDLAENQPTTVQVRFEVNYDEHMPEGEIKRWYSEETWWFVRDRAAKSKPPEVLTSLGCPNCGAPLREDTEGECPSCRETISNGKFNWFVGEINIERQERDPLTLSGTPVNAPELAARVDDDLEQNLSAYRAEHPSFVMDAFLSRAKDVFFEVQRAWSDVDDERLRPYVSDRQFGVLRAWLTEYRQKGLRNQLSEVEIIGLEPVKLVTDRYFTSLTVRIRASMVDLVLNGKGLRVGGSSRTAREFTEYWTFIKGTASELETISDISKCPSCGAELKVGMTGVCGYCSKKITTGDFDWVLSMIEQDESYGG